MSMPGEDLILRVEKMSRHFGGLKRLTTSPFTYVGERSWA